MQESANFSRRDQSGQLDRIDRLILHLLQVDGRLSNSRLAGSGEPFGVSVLAQGGGVRATRGICMTTWAS
jgi:hypothetical protein